MEQLPFEIIRHILHFLDLSSLNKISFVSKLMYQCSQMKEISNFFTKEPYLSFVKATGLSKFEQDVSTILELRRAIDENNPQTLRKLLFDSENYKRNFYLWAPYYDPVNTEYLYGSYMPRRLYWNQEKASQKTKNKEEVTYWIIVEVEVSSEEFIALYLTKVLQTERTKKDLLITNFYPYKLPKVANRIEDRPCSLSNQSFKTCHLF